MKKNKIKFRPQNGLLPLAPTGNNIESEETLFGTTLLPKSELEGGFCITKALRWFLSAPSFVIRCHSALD